MPSLSEQLTSRIRPAQEHTKDFRQTAEKLLIDIAGLCVAARNTDYVLAALRSWESPALHRDRPPRALDSTGAAFVDGTAAHGEDFDETTRARRRSSFACTTCGTKSSLHEAAPGRLRGSARQGLIDTRV